ncbi:MAG: type II toxin-antitoxin system RelE/ParE family toxin [SAR202 cluster bacterium]|nr:type II toxin-antitoxin system RelE/ParE family toxin [SAR202 cluster bacterium]
MIRSFRDKDTQRVFLREQVRGLPLEVQRIAQRKLVMLNAAESLQDLRVPPGNRLEALSGDRKGQHSIRVNDQWRICFHWSNGDAYDVEITDYH